MLEISFILIISAFVAGVLMFLAPCTLPIVPAYLAFIAGVESNDDISLSRVKYKIRTNALFFTLGFSGMFVILGSLAGSLGAVVAPWQTIIAQVGGVIIIFFGLSLLGLFRIRIFEHAPKLSLPMFLKPGSPSAAAGLGIIFALGWSPCVGPVLATVLVIASTSSSVLSGALLLGVFSLGMAIPFLLVAWFYSRAVGNWLDVTNATKYSTKIGAFFMIGLGVLLATNSFGLLLEYGYIIFDSLGLDWLYDWY